MAQRCEHVGGPIPVSIEELVGVDPLLPHVGPIARQRDRSREQDCAARSASLLQSGQRPEPLSIGYVSADAVSHGRLGRPSPLGLDRREASFELRQASGELLAISAAFVHNSILS